MAEKEATKLPSAAWFLILVAIFALGKFYEHVIPEDGAPVPAVTQAANTLASAPSAADPALVGVWRSGDDPKFTRAFAADGTVGDRYEGNESASAFGTWIVADPSREDVGAPADSLGTMKVIKLTFSDGQIMYYGVSAESSDRLVLIYLARGNALSFTRVR